MYPGFDDPTEEEILRKRVKELEQRLGLLQIAHDHKARLLESCEKALAERDGLAS